jgi:uncharacterized protein (UPF0332 family)/predicted nucleotidyltransferase
MDEKVRSGKPAGRDKEPTTITRAAAGLKDEALRIFVTSLLGNGVKDCVAKVILFGSYAEGRADRESDIDVLVLAGDQISKVEDACLDAQLSAAMATGESVEPIVKCLDEARYIDSLFMYQVMRHGKELYTMTGKEIRKRESQGYLDLAQQYLEAAEKNAELGLDRAVVDLGYNACELAVKGLLLRKENTLPSRHSGVVGRFGKLYVQTGESTKELGRRLNLALNRRNRARYEPHAEITPAYSKAAIALARDTIALLEQYS